MMYIMMMMMKWKKVISSDIKSSSSFTWMPLCTIIQEFVKIVSKRLTNFF